MRIKRPWTEYDYQTLRIFFPDSDTRSIAELLGRSIVAVQGKASILGLKKSTVYMRAQRNRINKELSERFKGKRQ